MEQIANSDDTSFSQTCEFPILSDQSSWSKHDQKRPAYTGMEIMTITSLATGAFREAVQAVEL